MQPMQCVVVVVVAKWPSKLVREEEVVDEEMLASFLSSELI